MSRPGRNRRCGAALSCYHGSPLRVQNVIHSSSISMMPTLTSVQHRFLRLLLLPALLLALSAHAGNISFNLSLHDQKLTLLNQGNSPAFYPTVLRMLADGRWEPLLPAPGASQPVELAPNGQLELIWPDQRPLDKLTPIEALRPVMVRFFDQAGAGFGQISFFSQPLNASDEQMLNARYVDGRMTITPPASPAIRASWLLWPQEDGIAPLTMPIDLQHRQPAARRFEWQPGMETPVLDLGKGLPVAFLLHETEQGIRSQVVSGGHLQGRQQRAGWLDATTQFYLLAKLAAAAAIALLLWHAVGRWRNRTAA